MRFWTFKIGTIYRRPVPNSAFECQKLSSVFSTHCSTSGCTMFLKVNPPLISILCVCPSPSRRGFIMGVWNSHTSVGNILGSLIAGVFVSSAWGMSFIVPGIIIASTGVLCFFFLVESESDLLACILKASQSRIADLEVLPFRL